MLNNLSSVTSDITRDFFNNYIRAELDVAQNVDEAVIGYFEKITNNKDSARLLAGAVIYTATSQNINVMEILQQFQTLSKNQLTGFLTMFLNLNRVGTSRLGISNTPKASKYITRSIIA